MKRLLLGTLAVLAMFSLVACDKKEVTPNGGEIPPPVEESTEPQEPSYQEKYIGLVEDYQKAIEAYDLEDVDADSKIPEILSDTLIMHIKRYAENGVELLYAYDDIDQNGTDELLVGANNGLGAIYAYDNETKEPVAIAFQSTLERGNMSVYDNGIILMEGAGGAALHYYEFGKIGSDGKSYQQMEYIQEEYTEGNETPTYTNAETGEVLEYQSLEEIMNQYIGGAKKYPFGDATDESSFEMTNPVIDTLLEGSWKNDEFGFDCVYTFNADGTGTYEVADSVTHFTYQTQDGHISILNDGDDISFDTMYSINDNVLNVLDSNGDDTLYQKM